MKLVFIGRLSFDHVFQFSRALIGYLFEWPRDEGMVKYKNFLHKMMLFDAYKVHNNMLELKMYHLDILIEK